MTINGGKATWNYDYGVDCPTNCSEATKCGPACWSKVDDVKNMCNGFSQSPINIVSATVDRNLKPPIYQMNAKCNQWVQYADSKTWTVIFDEASCADLNLYYAGMKYRLIQAHFHLDSEHLIGNGAYSSEVHFVHSSKEGKLLVVGVLLDAKSNVRENNFLSIFWDVVKKNSGTSNPMPQAFSSKYEGNSSININPYISILPGSANHFVYSGSLTTPPCTEGVQWILYSTPVQISESDRLFLKYAIENGNGTVTFKNFDNRNARPSQPLNSRIVKECRPSENVIEKRQSHRRLSTGAKIGVISAVIVLVGASAFSLVVMKTVFPKTKQKDEN